MPHSTQLHVYFKVSFSSYLLFDKHNQLFQLKMPNSRRKNKTLASFNGKKVNRYHNDFVDQDMMSIETG